MDAQIIYKHNDGGGCVSRELSLDGAANLLDQGEAAAFSNDCGVLEVKYGLDSNDEIQIEAHMISDAIELEYVVFDLNGRTEMQGVIKEGLTKINPENLPTGTHVIAVVGYNSVEYLKFNKD